ncbi:MAG TPA: hypothetical protein VI193_06895 [Acidimicrobiia bacterium]
MEDLLYVAAAVGFFVAAAGYVWFCDRLSTEDQPAHAVPSEEQPL